MKKIITVSLIGLSLIGCVSNQSTSVKKNYNPETDARIRIFGQNQKPTEMTYGINCKTSPKGTTVSIGKSLGDAFSSFTRSSKNESIGIAKTSTTENMGKLDGILSKIAYREYVIPAHEAVNVWGAYNGLTTVSQTLTDITIFREGSCRSIGSSFIPDAGSDYEVAMYKKGRNCTLTIHKIVSENGQTVLKPIPTSEPKKCK